MAGLGGISIDLEARIARFESDIGRAARLLEREMSRSAAQSSRAIEQMRQQVDRQMDMMRRQFSTTATALVGFLSVRGAVQFGRELARINDGFINVQAALKQVTGSQNQLTAATRETFNISQRTYQSFESTAMLVGRTARALTSAGNDQATALRLSLKFTESINNAFILSGAKAIEAKNALLQLSQGLASGVLRGDEYRSVAEQGAKVTEILAKNLTEVNGKLELANGRIGITTGRLRELAYDGMLTTDLVVKAMNQSFVELSAQVGAIPITIERAFTQLTNAAEMYIGTSEEASAVGRSFAESISFLAANFNVLADALIIATGGVLTIFGARTIGALGRYVQGVMDARVATLAKLAADEASAQVLIAKTRAEDAAAAAARLTASAEFAKAEALHASTVMMQQQLQVQLNFARAEVARQESLLAMARTTAVRIRAENQLQVALAAQTVAQLQNLAAIDAAAVASDRLLVARSALVAANADLAVAERALAAAQAQGAAATGAATAAAGGMRAALSGLGKGMLALVGGPVGAWALAIGAVVYGLMELHETMDEGLAKQRQAVTSLQSVTKGIEDQIDALKRQASGLSEAAYEQTHAVAGAEASIVAWTAQLVVLQEELNNAGNREVLGLVSRINTLYESIALAKGEIKNYTDRLVDLAFAQMEARDAQQALNAAVAASGKPIADAVVKLREHTDKLRADNIELKQGLKARMLYEAQKELGFKTLKNLNDAQREQWMLLVNEIDTIVALTNENKKYNDEKRTARQIERDRRREQKEFIRDLKAQARAEEEARENLVALNKHLLETDRTLSGPMRKALIDNLNSWEKYNELVAKFMDNGPVTAEIHEDLAEAMERTNETSAERIALAEREEDVMGLVNAKLNEEIELIGLSESEKRAELIVRELINEARQKEVFYTDEQIEAFRRETLARVQLIELLQAQAEEQEKTNKIMMSGMEDFFDAFADQLASGEADWDDFGKSLKNIWKKTVAEMISQTLKLQILNPMMNSLFGTNLPTGQGGTFGNVFSSVQGMFTGYGQFGNQAGWNAASANGPPGQLAGQGNQAFGSSVFGNSAGQWFGGNTGMAAAGNYMQAAQGIYQVYALTRNGPGGWDGAAQGAMAGASAGTAIMPGIGTVIGLVVGALAGYFGGGGPVIRVADKERDATASSRLDDMIGVARDRMPPGTATAFANGIAEFDNVIADMLDDFDDGADYIQEIRAALAGWSIRVEDDAATVENVLNQRFGAMLATFDETVRAYVGTSGKVEERVQRLQEALFMLQAVEVGGLVEDFETLSALITEYRREGESLESTYNRLAGSTVILEDALEMLGRSLDLNRSEFIGFAVEMSEAAGSVERAGQLWNSFFQTFYTDAERGTLAVAEARRNAEAEFADIGANLGSFEGAQGLAAFRAAFLAVQQTLTPEELIEWLEAAEALGLLDASITALANVTGEAVGDITGTLAELEAARAAYADFATNLFMQLEDANSSEFVNELRAIAIQYNDNVEQLNTLARAAGLAAAREEDLANALELSTIQRVKAIRALEAQGRSLVADLGYGRLGILDQQIADMEQRERDAAAAVRDFGGALNDVTQRARDNIDLLLGDLSPLRDREKLQLALEAQRAGRVAPEDVLQIGRRLFASGTDYQNLFNEVLAIGDRRPQGGGRTGGGGGGGSEFQMSDELMSLIAERDRLAAEADKANRFLQASELAQIVADLAGAQGITFEEVAASLGFSLDMLAEDLNMPAMQDLITYLETLQANSYSIEDIAATITAGEAGIIYELEEIYDLLNNKSPIRDNIDPPDPFIDAGVKSNVEYDFAPSTPVKGEVKKMCELLEAIAENTGVSAETLDEIRRGGDTRRVEGIMLQPRNVRNGLK